MLQSVVVLDPTEELSANPGVNRLVVMPDGGKDITITQVRHLSSWVGQTGFVDEPKQAILLSAHRLGRDAQHALLKTLEEPARDTSLVLVTASREALLPTIHSRCAHYEAGQLHPRQLESWGLLRQSEAPLIQLRLSFAQLIELAPTDRWLQLEPLLQTKDAGMLAQHLNSWLQEVESLLAASHTQSVWQTGKYARLLLESLAAVQARVLPRLVFSRLLSQIDSGHQ